MKVGLITYHSAYNFGSVLQAYATQAIISQLGHKVEIINYRMPSQKNFYRLFPKNIGKKQLIINLLTLSTVGKRKKRQEKYENLFDRLFVLTEEFNEPEEFGILSNRFDVYISGSDQVWNNKSNEYIGVDWKKYMGPYLLDFTSKRKISYASSPESMSREELEEIKEELSSFKYISCREQYASNILEDVIGSNIETVLDPTLLLRKEEWLKLTKGWSNKYTNSKYIFYYVFKGMRGLNSDLKIICEIAEKRGLTVITSVPLSFVVPRKNLINAVDADAIDFLGLINNAEYIITNSYHGTLFSVNFNKNFYSLQSEKIEYSRVEQMAKRLCFSDRVIYSLENANLDSIIDFSTINNQIRVQTAESISYLKRAIENED